MTQKIIKLLPHQEEALELTKDTNKVAYYYDMGLGKTFIGSEKMKALNARFNLVICQKSKLNDWYEHFKTFYEDYNIIIYSKPMKNIPEHSIIIINYDLVWRRNELLNLTDFTLMLDESSCIKNEKSNRTKFILKMQPTNVILLSGTPTGGKYEELYSQCRLLGWKISKKAFWDTYIVTKKMDINGFSIPIVIGYKNVDRLKNKLRQYGAIFKKTDEVLTLPEQIDNVIKVEATKEYKKFVKTRLVEVDGKELVGDTSLTKLLYQRQLASQYNSNKSTISRDLLESTNDRVIIFYNFNEELEKLINICDKLERPISVINGSKKDLKAYETKDNSVTLVQYQAGAMGLNLQLSNKIIYYSLPLSSELFEQSKKRIHRIGQKKSCLYYYLITSNSIEEEIYKTLAQRRDFTNKLFEEIDNCTEVIREEPKEEKITVAKIISKEDRGIKTIIDDDTYYGTGTFLLKSSMCRSDFKKRVESQLFREVAADTFKSNKEDIYEFKEKELINDGSNYITLKDEGNYVHINTNYYKYFKELGVEFRFNTKVSPVGMFKNNEWVGIVLPIKVVRKEEDLKENAVTHSAANPKVEADFNKNEFDESEMPF